MTPHLSSPSYQKPDDGPPIKRGLNRALALVASLALIAAVLFAVGAGDILGLLAGADPTLVAVALAVVVAQIGVAAWRWRFTAGRLGLDVPMGRAFLEYALAGLVNMTLPGGVAGDVLRAARTMRSGAGTRAAVRSVVLERIAGQAAFWLLAGAGLILWVASMGSVPGGAATTIAALPAAAVVVVGCVVGLARSGPAPVRAALADLGPDASRAFVTGGAFPVQLFVGLALAASYVGVFWLAGAAIGAALPPLAAVTLIPLALLAMLIPAGVGGWGLREGAAAVLWPLAGLSPAEGAATAALYGILVTLGALPGLAALLQGRTGKASGSKA